MSVLDNENGIMTVRGRINGESLGNVLMYEHLLCDHTKSGAYVTEIIEDEPITMNQLGKLLVHPYQNANNLRLDSGDQLFRELENLSSSCHGGIQTIVEVTSPQYGRNPIALKKLSEETGLHIILGANVDPSTLEQATSQSLSKAIERELLFGIEDTGICCGFIGEIIFSEALFSSNDTVQMLLLEAICMAQKSTGAPMMIDCTCNPSKIHLLLDWIVSFGGDLNKTILTHMDTMSAQWNVLESFIERGVFLSFDGIGKHVFLSYTSGYQLVSDQQLVHLIASLLKNPSFSSHIVLSNGIFLKTQLYQYGGLGYRHLTETFLSMLKEMTLTSNFFTTSQDFLHNNPRKLLEWVKPLPSVELPKEYLCCSICQQLFEPKVGEYFTKYTMIYCGTKCLRKHRQQAFK